jgi:putative hydrolase of the HAD superfamily
MVRALVFDLDDTLYEEMQFVRSGFRAVSRYISGNCTVDEDAVYQVLLEVLANQGCGEVFDVALKKLGLYKKSSIPEMVNVYRSHEPAIAPYPDVKPALTMLRDNGCKLGLITDGNVDVQKNKLRMLKIGQFFGCAVFSDQYGVEKRKPHIFSYKKVLEELQAIPHESAYIGDNPLKDFSGARKLGMYTVRIMRGQYKTVDGKKQQEADVRIESLRQIFDVLNLMCKNR